MSTPQIGIIMGSDSDMNVMQAAADIAKQFDVPFEVTVVSAHRTPLRMVDYATNAKQRGLQVIIAGAGGAAHLPGMIAAITTLPVIGVPVKSSNGLDGWDSILSILQMPSGVPVATVALNASKNAGLLAVQILALQNEVLALKMDEYKIEMQESVLEKVQALKDHGWPNGFDQ